MANENHGGGKFAKTQGHNRKTERAYDAKAKEYNAMVAQHKIGNDSRDSTGYTKPGSRKKVH